ncbi:hypothetical protein CQ476_19 [TM7 phage DolZOral124_53_65]|nr:hypothetical protein CQ476_19 [TM7 phage DolZOral124_53_65]
MGPVEGEIVGGELVAVLEEHGVGAGGRKALVEAFGGPFNDVGSILADFSTNENGEVVPGENTPKVTDVTQIQEMSAAREKRLALKNARTTVERKRKELKEESLKTGRAIDAVARYIKEQIEPVEKYLEEQEKFKELREKAEAAARLAARTEAIAKFDDPALYSLESMPEEAFQQLLIKLEKEAAEKAEAERKAEEARLAAEKAKRESQQKIAEENKKLQREAEEQRLANERKLARVNLVTSLGMVWTESLQAYTLNDDTVTAQDISELNEVKWKMLVSDVETKVTEARQAAEKQREAEQRRREELERQEAERRAAEEKAAREKAEAERRALMAPDKEKISAIVPKLAAIKTELPATKDPAAQELVKTIDAMIDKAIAFVEEKVEAL